ncbi:MAG: hypothetical protein WDZ45_02830 [Flavobacteriaceae bacterium]
MKKTKFLLILIISVMGFQSCFLDNDDKINLFNIGPEDVIVKDSDLYNLLVRVTNHEGDPLKDIVCIRFSYPFLIFTYDENFEIIDETLVLNDSQFYILLDNLPEDNSISLSYPIETTLTDGTPFSITTNEELIAAITACAQEEIIGFCNGLFQSQNCVWKVPFIDSENNTYASGVFSVNSDSSMNFNFQNTDYSGTWIFFFINGVLNFNINLAGTSQVAQDWNINFNVDYDNTTLILTSEIHDYFLKKVCEFNEDLNIGDSTPTEGILAFDRGFYQNGWRYIETHTADLSSEEWGCLSGDVTIATNEGIGDGYMSSAAIANYHLDLDNYQNNPAVCNADNDGSVSALSALLFGQNEGAYYDWFLPSIEELQTLYDNLHLEGLGNFENAIYWSSTQSSESHAKALDFSTGEIVEIPKNSSGIKTRIIRCF